MKESPTGQSSPTPVLDELYNMVQGLKNEVDLLSQMYDIALRYCSQREYLMSRYDELTGSGTAEKVLRAGNELVMAQLPRIESKYFEPQNGHELL